MAVDDARFVQAAAELLSADSLSPPPRDRQPDRASAVLGRPQYEDVDCALVCRPAELASLPDAVLDRFTSKLWFEDEAQLRGWVQEQPESVFQAVCFAGQDCPWQGLALLAERGFGASRLPALTAERMLALCRIDRERAPLERPTAIWLIAPANDGYTRAVAHGVLPRLKREVARLNRSRSRCSLHLSLPSSSADADIRSGAIVPGMVVLLAHGDDDGRPILREAWQMRVLEECARQGAIIFHLGCHGAGRAARSPFLPLTSELDLELATSPATDSLSPFASEILASGARAVLAHVGETWSTCFGDGTPFSNALAWMVSGAPLAHAIASLQEDANGLHGRAHVALRKGDLEAAAHAWLRCLDLKQFVLVGPPLVRL